MDDHIDLVAKPSHREKILSVGLQVVHRHGFGHSSVRDIVEAAGVPQGSFTNHFVSKDAFGLAVINRYYDDSAAVIRSTLRNDGLKPLQRLALYIDAGSNRLLQEDMRNGCLFGNFIAETSEHSEPIRHRLIEILGEVRDSIAYCLTAAVAAGELRPGFDVAEFAGFMVSALQGANLLSKAQRSTAPLEQVKRVILAQLKAE